MYHGFRRKLICYKGISLFWTYLNSRLFVCSKCTIESHISNFQPFPTSFVLFQAFTHIFELNYHELEKHYKWSLERLKGGMVSSFHPHSMCKKVERVTAKTGCTSCTKRTISFEVSGFHTETRLLQRDLIFLNSIVFLCSNAPFKATSSIFNPFWLRLLFFMHLLIILSYKTLKLKSISNKLWKGWNLAWYHHLTHIACARK